MKADGLRQTGDAFDFVGCDLAFFCARGKRSGLLESLQELLKDAWQTDVRFSIRHEFWPEALVVFAIHGRGMASIEKNRQRSKSARSCCPT